MSATIILKQRTPHGTTGARFLRASALVPGVLYGDHIASRHFSVDLKDFPKLRSAGGSSGLIDVQLPGEDGAVKAIVQDIQTDPVSGRLEHVDLYQVRMDKKLHTEAHLTFTGESAAVKDLGGILVKQHTELPIECLPADLATHIEVPIGSLATFENVIRVRDLALPKGIATHLPADEIIAAVSEPRSEEELSQLSAEIVAGAGPEVLTEKKEEATAGGEAASGGTVAADAPASKE
ncbi:MAG: 50S ribosomal protein L25 [Patescibacteria group bacterium]